MSAQSQNTRLNDQEYRRGELVLRSWPRVIDLGLTLKCNLRCVMCISRHLPQIDLSQDCLERVEPYLQHCEQLTWNDAGELFASPRVKDFVRLSQQVHPPISYVSTNLQLVGPHIDAVVGSGLTDMSVSIDAARRETYEAIRVGARWERLIANLEALQRRKAELGSRWPRLTFVYVLMRSNIGELVEFVDFAQRYGASRIEVFRLAPNHTGLERDEAPSQDEAKAVYRQALKRASEIGMEIQHTYFNNNVLLEEMQCETAANPPTAHNSTSVGPIAAQVLATEACPPQTRPQVELLHNRRFEVSSGLLPVCPAPWREFLIQTDGKVRTCCYSREVMGDLNTQSLPEIWNGPAYRDFRRRIVLRDYTYCRDCHYLARTLAGGIGDDSLATVPGDDTWLSGRQRDCVPALEQYIRDREALLRYKHALRNGQLRTAVRGFRSVLGPLARTARSIRTTMHRLAGAWTEQRLANGALHRYCCRLHQDLLVAEEAIRILAGERGAPAPVVADGQSSIDALFYSARLTAGNMPPQIAAGDRFEVTLSVCNTSALTWPTQGEHAVKLAYGWCFDNGAVHVQDGLRSPLPQPVHAGEEVTVRATVQAPQASGSYILVWDLVYDPFAWFKDHGCPPLEVPVAVRDRCETATRSA